ncbi:MAG: TolC family protein [Verrucomicrobiota bacterium]
MPAAAQEERLVRDTGDPIELEPAEDVTQGRLDFAAPDAPTFSLPDCVNRALRNSPRVLNAQREIERIRGVRTEVTAQALPNVTASGQFQAEENARLESPLGGDIFPTIPGLPETEVDTSQSDPQGLTWNVGIQVTQLVFSGGRVGAAIEIARLQEEAAFFDLQTAIDDTILEVRRAFYNVLVSRALIEVNRLSVRLLEEELANQQKRRRAGTATKFNVLRAEVELANAKPALIRARNSLRVSLAELARLMAVDADPQRPDLLPFRVAGTLGAPSKIYSLPEAMRQARANRPELKSSRRQVEIERKTLDVDRAGLLPEVSIFGGYDVIGNRLGEFGGSTDGFVGGIQAEWAIFDGFETKGQMDATRARIAQAENDEDDLRRQVELEVRQAYSQLVEAVEFEASQRKNVESAAESLRLAIARFNAGVGIQLDTLDSRFALTEAQTNQLEARFDYSVALAELEHAIGISTSIAVRNKDGSIVLEKRAPASQLRSQPLPTLLQPVEVQLDADGGSVTVPEAGEAAEVPAIPMDLDAPLPSEEEKKKPIVGPQPPPGP